MEYDQPANSEDSAVILFDGVCNLCNGLVNFLIDQDEEGYFKVGTLQSDEATALLQPHGLDEQRLDSLVLLDGENVYRRSTAALHIARRLGWPWALLYSLIVLPRALRDAVYDWVAANRYRWFGRRDQCRIPTPELKDRFL